MWDGKEKTLDIETRQVLLNMKAELSKGWVQGDLKTKKGVCIFGATLQVCDVPLRYDDRLPVLRGRGVKTADEPTYVMEDDSAAFLATEALARQAGVPWDELALWNDDPARTHEEIVGLIDATLAADPVEEEVYA
jgi:hypothetical protein